MIDMLKNEELKLVYEQCWIHLRHQELQRVHFTSAFALILGGIFALIGLIPTESTLIVLTYMCFFSVFGFLIIHRWNLVYIHYREFTRGIQCYWQIPDPTTNVWKKNIGIFNLKFSSFKLPVSKVYLLFYLFCVGLCFSLILSQFYRHISIILGIPLIIIALIFLIVSIYTEKYYDAVRNEIDDFFSLGNTMKKV
jgi:hypothetical protein